jgi:hypothetical protein
MHPLACKLGARLRSFVRSPHLWGVLATVVVGFALFFLPHQVKADLSWQSYLAGAIAWVLGLIVNFLGSVISVLIYILMGFLQYNGFADAPPVMMGWVIIRDLMNMVFIIVLIISAVATILNYETSDLHVKNVLPKLIGAAVLINFSKMIVGVLVDVSQVVMLTFVNAFQASGVGNFSQLLGLPSFTQLRQGDSAGSAASPQSTQDGSNVILDVLLAYMLAMAMLVISIGVILIMILFTVARIVGIWVLLIVSPAAFLASSLPKKLQKIFGSLAHDFWEKLTAFLVGGPTMAFFLWLAFATVRSTQQMTADGGVATRLGLFNREATPYSRNGVFSGNSLATGAATQGTNFFLSRVGNADGIASFIVGVALMLIGLEQSVRAAGNASSIVGQYAGTIAGGAKSAARWLATRPVATPWNAVDRRLKLTDKAASALALVPGLNSLSGGKIGSYANYRKRELDQMAKDDMTLYGNMSGIFKKAKGSSIRTWASLPVLRTDADVKAAQQLGQNFVDGYKTTKRELSAEHEHHLMDHPPHDAITGRALDPKNPADEEEIKNQAKAFAAGQADAKSRDGFKLALDQAKKLHDWEGVSKLEEQADANPHLWKDIDRGRFARSIKKMSDEEFEKNDQISSDGDALMMRAEQAGAIEIDKATGAIKSTNAANFDQMVTDMPKIGKRVRALQGAIAGHQTVPNGAVNAGATSALRNTSFMQDASKVTSRVYNGATGDRVYSPAEQTGRTAIHGAFSSPARGRSAPGVLDAATAAQVNTAFETMNVAMKDLQNMDAATRPAGMPDDGAISGYFAQRVQGDLTAWADPRVAMATLSRVGEQMKDLDEKSQEKILAAINLSGHIQNMAYDLEKMTAYQQEQFLNVVRQAKELSRSTDINIRNEANDFLDELKIHMPRNRQNVPNPAGGPNINIQAPAAFAAVLYKK